MITLSVAAQDILTRSHVRYLAVESWRNGQLLAADIPVSEASEETDRTLRVPERVTVTVPRLDRGVSWSPVADDHPLAANGQTLRVKLGVGLANGEVEWFQRGVFLVEDATADGDTVTVTAVGLLALVDEARLVSPHQPSGTLVSTLRGLIEPALTVVVDATLVDRSVPAAVNFDEDRLGAVLQLLDAWPADAYVDPAGVLQVKPAAQASTPVLALTDGTGGTVITASGSSTRDGAANVVVARGTASDGGQVQGVAYDTSGGPKSYGGPFNPLPVPHFFSSPLLTTVAQCNEAAATVLARLRRGTGRELRVSMVPHPGVQVGDVVSVTTDDHTGLACSVEALALPYQASGGAMTLTVRTA
jgi:Domain of unknown function (DUF5047)